MAGARQVGVVVRGHTGASLIDLTIAIVIKTVAFAGWTAILSWWHPVGGQVRDAKTKGVADTIINQTVAVRVDVVAFLSFRPNLTFTCLAPCAVDAALHTGLAADLGALQFGRVAVA